MQPEIICQTLSARYPKMCDAVMTAFGLAVDGQSKLPPEVLAMPGMSGRRYRHFVNNLVAEVPSYMEIGTWAGSTLCSAVYGNEATALAVDNWSGFGGPAEHFFRYLAQFKGSSRVSFLDRDFHKIDYGKLASTFDPFSVYLFDGPHDWDSQYIGLTRVQPMLARHYVQIVDDWNFSDVRTATMKAIDDLGLQINLRIEVRTTLNDEHAPEPIGENSDWHNGVFIAVLSRG